jgi:hypothetical protein
MIEITTNLPKALEELAKREKVAEMFCYPLENKSFQDMRQKLKDSNVSEKALAIAERFANEISKVDKQTTCLIQDIYQQVEGELLKNSDIAFVILGSSASGGMLVRELMGTSRKSDLDLGLVYNQDIVKQEDIKALENLVECHTEQLSTKHGFSHRFHLCLAARPSKHHAPNLHNTTEAYNLLDALLDTVKYDNQRTAKEQLVMYLRQSIPFEINMRNKFYVYTALRQLHSNNPEKWDKAVELILTEWSQHHYLRGKHLRGEYLDTYYSRYRHRRSKMALNDIEAHARISSRNLTTELMIDFLESTSL